MKSSHITNMDQLLFKIASIVNCNATTSNWNHTICINNIYYKAIFIAKSNEELSWKEISKTKRECNTEYVAIIERPIRIILPHMLTVDYIFIKNSDKNLEVLDIPNYLYSHSLDCGYTIRFA